MTKFTGCIDIHNGQVKQIVGGSLSNKESELKTNFVSKQPAGYYADLYKSCNLQNSHVIKLGPGCDEAAQEALKAWPGALQVGGGINDTNAVEWLEAGASKVIVTSFLFPEGGLDEQRLKRLSNLVGKDRLVIDLSCRRVEDSWFVAMDRWQRITSFELTRSNLEYMATYCSEFLVHAADVEGLCRGVDEQLVAKLGEWSPIRVVYAGGGRSIADLELVKKLSNGRVDLTIGSALDIFGGNTSFQEVIAWNDQN